LLDYSSRASEYLNKIDAQKKITYEEVEKDIRDIKESIIGMVNVYFASLQDKIMKEFITANQKLSEELRGSIKGLAEEVNSINKAELADSKGVIIGLNAAFNEPKAFEKTCQDYIENYFLLEKSVKENERIHHATAFIDSLEPWDSSSSLPFRNSLILRQLQNLPKVRPPSYCAATHKVLS
jgi:hypothetical protein